jgi:periplasmic copper chaperone A
MMTARSALAAAALLLLASCARGPAEPQVRQAWVRLPAVSGQPAAAYFTIQGGRSAAMLVQVESAVAARVELHASMAGTHGAMTMHPLSEVEIPAGQVTTFAPGARHAMIHGLDPAIRPGTAVPLRFGFADGSAAEAEAKTVAAGDDAPY